MWFKVDDSFFSNPKTAMLSDGATALWLRSGSWSAQQLTDGFIPARMVPMFRGSDDSVRELCDVGLWERDDERDGYRFHDWSDYQPDGEEVDALRRKRSEAGKRGADRRWKRKTVDENGKNGKTDGKCHGKLMANRWQVDGKSMANSCPVPVPVPDKKEKEEYSSSFSKEIGVSDFELVGEKAHANADIIRNYPKLDLSDAWAAFAQHHSGETRFVNDWTRLWKGWCQRRANMSGIPPSKRHVHTWKCRHVLEALGRDEETAQADEKACELADKLNKEKS
ncbi:hypothetical protein [Bifidobacterium pseudocatenulatum]|uniref:hypothetical protein n=1 Tax=Bifidobacterium pseudocatenulatum TaxID=28026 RepID=UPI0006C0CB6D|nr:hypothetical protein [Bifidobacterium pseudocatenulatum]CUO05776.1 Uncharacterised protein [Bifidobacterium pseudocatenulatum]